MHACLSGLQGRWTLCWRTCGPSARQQNDSCSSRGPANNLALISLTAAVNLSAPFHLEMLLGGT